ncbi:hypothetical protein L873DRAFT_1820107 [Choiromyces venosus 120613-1]|uniref:Uncharacterized protein n=1 Tax=Choiromyces venosus 120613-1 TaxID=1336337 RepID=A0A3N4IYP4_9PEZI|nr:hypothetical protein L873DRAFT_1820107 [Choiromyces venosus 120613-1]
MKSDGFIGIHDVRPEIIPPPEGYNVLFLGVTHQTLDITIAEELGLPYLGETTKVDAEERVQMLDGYTYGPNVRTIFPLVIIHGEVAW